MVRSHRYNMEALLKFIILVGFALFFSFTVITGKTRLYVHPRIVPYMIFGIAAMFLIAFTLLGDIFKPQKKKARLAGYIFFLIPLFLAFALPAKSVASDSMSFGNAQLVQKNGYDDSSNSENEYQEESTADNDIQSSGSEDSQIDDSADNLYEESSTEETDGSEETEDDALAGAGTIIMNDDSFVMWVQEINNKPEEYIGRKIQVDGFVLRDKEYKSNEFVPARLMMSCCAADLQPVGLMAHYSKASELKSDTWFEVTGTIKLGEFDGEAIPVIQVENLKSIEKPANEYVYPY